MCDPLHLNHVRLLTKEDAPAYPTLAAGDMLISVRNLNTIAIWMRRLHASNG